jgi:hypothetical protein
MGHRYIELPFGNVEVAAVEANTVWVRSRIGVQAAAIDLATGEVRHRFQLPATTLLDCRIRRLGGYVAANIERGEVSCIALASGAQAWRRSGELRGVTATGFVVAARREPGGASLIEVSPLGALRTLIDAPCPPYELPPAAVSARHVWTVSEKKLIGVPLVTSSGTSSFEVRLDSDDVGLMPWRDGVLVIESREERSGARTRLLAPELSTGQLREVATVQGELFVALAAATDDLLVAVETREGEDWDCQAVALRGAEHPIRLSVPKYARANAGASIAAIAQHGALAMLCVKDLQPRCVRLPLPTGSLPSVGVGDGLICATVSKALFVVDASAIPWASAVTDHGAQFDPLVAKHSGDPVPATVVFAGDSLVAVDHPRLGRLNLKRSSSSPTLASNDRVLLDSLREDLPGVWAVEAWHKEGDGPSTSPGPEKPLVLDVSQMPPAYVEPAPTALENLSRLRQVSQQLEFAIPSTLEKLAGEYDRDETFRRWLNRLSFLVEITGFSTAWQGSDPCMIGIAGNGGGDVIALYCYPPAHRPGGVLPVVDWWHETNEVSWLASDFGTYLSHRLHQAREFAPDVVALILERLALPTGFPKPTEQEPPAWFLAAHGSDVESPDRADAARLAKESPELAERKVVRLLRDTPDDDDAREMLGKLYDRLGWEWHKQNLDRSCG